MTQFEAGDVVRVLFPHVESDVARYRPALVVTREPVGPEGLLIWVAMITNAKRRRWEGDIAIEGHRDAGLPIPSMVRTTKIATLETAAAEKIGRVSGPPLDAVQLQLRKHLGLS